MRINYWAYCRYICLGHDLIYSLFQPYVKHPSKEKKATGRFIERDEKTGKWSLVENEAFQDSENGRKCDDQPDDIGSSENAEAELIIEKMNLEDENFQSLYNHENRKHAEDIERAN